MNVHVFDSGKVVVNLFSYILNDTETLLLGRGRTFSVPPNHLDAVDIRTSFEMFFRHISPLLSNGTYRIKHRLRELCNRYIYSYKPRQVTNISREECNAFHKLLKNKGIVICRSDKGNGVVLLDRTDYINKLQDILNDSTKFQELPDDPTASRESKLQRYLYNLKRKGIFDQHTYDNIRPSGSQPSRLYGLPKTHKANVPLRPIVSCIGSYSYNLAKFLVNMLRPINTGKYCVKDLYTYIASSFTSTQTNTYKIFIQLTNFAQLKD